MTGAPPHPGRVRGVRQLPPEHGVGGRTPSGRRRSAAGVLLHAEHVALRRAELPRRQYAPFVVAEDPNGGNFKGPRRRDPEGLTGARSAAAPRSASKSTASSGSWTKTAGDPAAGRPRPLQRQAYELVNSKEAQAASTSAASR